MQVKPFYNFQPQFRHTRVISKLMNAKIAMSWIVRSVMYEAQLSIGIQGESFTSKFDTVDLVVVDVDWPGNALVTSLPREVHVICMLLQRSCNALTVFLPCAGHVFCNVDEMLLPRSCNALATCLPCSCHALAVIWPRSCHAILM